MKTTAAAEIQATDKKRGLSAIEVREFLESTRPMGSAARMTTRVGLRGQIISIKLEAAA